MDIFRLFILISYHLPCPAHHRSVRMHTAHEPTVFAVPEVLRTRNDETIHNYNVYVRKQKVGCGNVALTVSIMPTISLRPQL